MAEATTDPNWIPIDYSAADPERDHLEKMWAMLKKRGPSAEDLAIQAALRAVVAHKQGATPDAALAAAAHVKAPGPAAVRDARLAKSFERYKRISADTRAAVFTEANKVQVPFTKADRQYFKQMISIALGWADLGLHDVHDEIRALKVRIAELESVPFHYDGPHESGKQYRRGMFVTHRGSLWHCNHPNDARPGDGPGWTLAVKKGDAR